MLKFLEKHWERVLFVVVGFALLGYSFWYLSRMQITEASVVFAMSFLSFIYSNLARFKRFKGLGFEAELWEDKQKEAADLIDRLKNVVSIYTREVILGKVMQGRWGGSDGGWKSHWKLYDELVDQHTKLGQHIDFSDLKQKLDAIFVFDMTSPLIQSVRKSILAAKTKASDKINKEFGSPIRDAAGYGKKIGQLNQAQEKIEDPFKISHEGDLARVVLDMANNSQISLKENFDIEVEFDPDTVEKLQVIANLHSKGPIAVTESLIALTEKH